MSGGRYATLDRKRFRSCDAGGDAVNQMCNELGRFGKALKAARQLG
jgi:hypothetical protein